MSQAKVDQNKQLKANRKQIMARQKREHMLVLCCGWLLLIAVLGWAGYSAYNVYQNNRPAIYTDLTAINDYANALNTAE